MSFFSIFMGKSASHFENRGFNLVQVIVICCYLRACLHEGRLPPANRATQLEGLKDLKHSPPLHVNWDSQWAAWLSFERPLNTTNKKAYQRNFLTASLILLSLTPLAAAFQCIGLLFCTLLITTKKFSPRPHFFPVYLTSAGRDSPVRTVHMAKSYPA